MAAVSAAKKTAKKPDFSNPAYYTNRELSWIMFNERILDEARDKSLPLLERENFLSITASNQDEFFMVGVASLKDQEEAGYDKPDIAGMTPAEQLKAISTELHRFADEQYRTYRSLLPKLKEEGIEIVPSHRLLSEEDAAFVDQFFKESIYPVLTPMAVDSSRPFPLIRNKTLNIALLLRSKKEAEDGELEFATVQVPDVVPRLVRIPTKDGTIRMILLEEVIERNLDKLFLNYDVIAAQPYRIERNADLPIDEEEAADLLKEIERQLKRRQWGQVIKLEVDQHMDRRLLDYLKEQTGVSEEDVYEISGPLDLTFLGKIYGMDGFPDLRDKPFTPKKVPEIDPELSIFDNIKKGDIFLHHPYETFDPVVEFVRQASVDPQVLAIKQTLYRVSGNSPIVAALSTAAENGKQVTVLVELKARFDEEHNIVWAKRLEKAGCHVLYGLRGLKTHSKITLVVRDEEDGIRRYVHLATGNYNDSTAKHYSDCGIMTCSRPIGEDATAVFNMLSGYSEPEVWNKLAIAPLWLRDRLLALIDREAGIARSGEKAYIIAKMNSLCDREVIEHLYAASGAGVDIQLIVRGICCLKTGIPGVSENIHVRSLVGRYLEHSRIFIFGNDGDEEVFMASADWMPRNLDKRVEIMFPVEDERIKKHLHELLDIQLADTLKARVMKMDGSGTYERVDRRGKVLMSAQQRFIEMATAQEPKEDTVRESRVFEPMENPDIRG
jgi:polyphosphate kinase